MSTVAEMTGLDIPRPTRVEGALAAVLLCLSLTEALFSDEQPAPTALRLLAAIVAPVAVAISRSWPEGAAGTAICIQVLDSLPKSPSGTLGTGFALLAIAFGLAAWARQPWLWLMALVAAATMRDLRAVDFQPTNAVIDWAFFGFVVVVGSLVRRRTEEAQALTTRLELAEVEREIRTTQAIARERAIIARELHDIVAHSVSLMVVQAGTARPMAQRIDRELSQVLETIEHTGRQALTELRRLLHVLRAEDEPDLVPLPDLSRLDDLIKAVRRAGVDAHATVTVPEGVSPGVALCAYRTVQEGLTNAMRHAGGSRVDVEVTAEERTLRVRVHDGGGVETARHLGAGTGLAGLQERVLLCGGQLTAGPDGQGFLLTVTLPMSDPAPPIDAGPEPWRGNDS